MNQLFCTLLFIFTAFPLTGQGAEEKLIYDPLTLRADDAELRAAPALVKGSHLKVYLPNLPYIYISHAINGGLFRPANNEHGWDYDLATAYQKIDDTTYEFKLRQGVVFQDGTPFNADAVRLNMEYFTYKPYLFTKLSEVFDHAEKIDDYTVRFHLSQKYGMFLNDVVWLQFYTRTYLEKYGWNGKGTGPNLAAPGPYGIGPYLLTEGYVEGDRQTPKIELMANPHYWDKRYPKIERVTIFTELNSTQAREMVSYAEGKLDLVPIAFEHKVETILSPYAKLVISPSNNSYAIHINMYNGHPKLQETAVRLALNQALHQANLLYFIFLGEGRLSPLNVAPDLHGVKEATQKIKPYSEVNDPYTPASQARLQKILKGLHLKVLTQENFMFLWRGLEDQLSKVGVTLEITVLPSEKEIFAQLFATAAGKNTKPWDLLIWGNNDWFFYHPWSNFLVYRTLNYWDNAMHWSSIPKDELMDSYLEDLFQTGVGEPGYNDTVYKIMQRAYDQAYMLYVPNPNNVFAVNKEVLFTPYRQAVLPLWEMEISTSHWSIRPGNYPEELKQPVEIVRKNFK
jgi:peptide/nickel transport system substrate-binding protein